MTIAILSRFSPPVLSFLKSCKQKKIETVFLWIGAASEPVPASSLIQHLYKVPSDMVRREEGIRLIASVLEHYNDISLYTINEAIGKWLVSNQMELGHSTRLMLQKEAVIEKILSKKNQADAARKAGLALLNTYYLTSDTKSLDSIKKSDYPLCIRPSAPKSVKPSFKVDIIPDRDSLETFMAGRSFSGRGIMAQPFLNLPNLVVHGSRTASGKTLGLQGFLVERKFEGLTLSIKPFDPGNSFLQKCIRFTEIMGITGPYHFEFLYDKEKKINWFLEINARMGGTTAKVYSLGYDEPGFLLQSFGHNIKITDKLEDKTSASKLALLKYLVYTMAGKITPLDYPGHESRLERVLKAISGLALYRDDILSLKDVKGAASIYLDSLKGKLG